MRSLLVVKPSSLGDIVHALQVVQTLARERPDCRITWVVRDRFAGLVASAGFVHETIIYERRAGVRAFVRLLRRLRTRRFDAVWDMQGLLRSGLMTAAAVSPEKWGRRDSRECSGLFYNRRVAMPAGHGPWHALEILLPFLRTAGVEPRLEFPLSLKVGAPFAWQRFFESDPDRTFVIFTDSRGAGKQWPRFSELTQLIFESIPGSRVAWCAGRPTEPDVSVPAGSFLNLTGCPLDEMIALVRQRATFIGNDSGPMHLSAASGNPVLAIFGPTSSRRFGPFPIDAPNHCAVEALGGRLELLEAEVVMTALKDLLGRVR